MLHANPKQSKGMTGRLVQTKKTVACTVDDNIQKESRAATIKPLAGGLATYPMI